jgi:hypothetical protein
MTKASQKDGDHSFESALNTHTHAIRPAARQMHHVRQLMERLCEGVGTFCDCCGHSSWLGIHKLSDPVEGFKVWMHTTEAAIKRCSVRQSACKY